MLLIAFNFKCFSSYMRNGPPKHAEQFVRYEADAEVVVQQGEEGHTGQRHAEEDDVTELYDDAEVVVDRNSDAVVFSAGVEFNLSTRYALHKPANGKSSVCM